MDKDKLTGILKVSAWLTVLVMVIQISSILFINLLVNLDTTPPLLSILIWSAICWVEIIVIMYFTTDEDDFYD